MFHQDPLGPLAPQPQTLRQCREQGGRLIGPTSRASLGVCRERLNSSALPISHYWSCRLQLTRTTLYMDRAGVDVKSIPRKLLERPFSRRKHGYKLTCANIHYMVVWSSG